MVFDDGYLPIVILTQPTASINRISNIEIYNSVEYNNHIQVGYGVSLIS